MNKSEAMGNVRGKDTGPEIYVRRLLTAHAVRYRLQYHSLPGKPDVYIGRIRTAIFVNGCFWHQHECLRGARPRTNTSFWAKKLNDNVARDQRVRAQLEDLGVHLVYLWTCEAGTYPDRLRALAAEYHAGQRVTSRPFLRRPKPTVELSTP